MPRLKIFNTYRTLRRGREILSVLIKYGFDDIVNAISSRTISKFRFRRKIKQVETLTRPQRLRFAFEELGTTFIKFGQILSTRSDILSKEYINEFEKFQDSIAPFDFSEVEKIILKEFGKEKDLIFSEFESVPIASASIAQVHKARLKSGEVVAVKIQRPNIENIINEDILILKELSRLLEKYLPESKIYQPVELVRQFEKIIKRELDFILEARSIDKFRINFKDDPAVFIPKVFWNCTTSKILTTEFIDGIKITDIESIEANNLDKKIIAENGARLILKEIFDYRFFHGDPHPGNLFVLKDNVIAAIDFGIIGRLDVNTVEKIKMIIYGLTENNVEKILSALTAMNIIEEETNDASLKFDLMEYMDYYAGAELQQIDIKNAMNDFVQIIHNHHLVLPIELSLMGKVLVVSEGVGRLLDPTFNMIEYLKPYVIDWKWKSMNPFSHIKDFTEFTEDFSDFAKTLPNDLKDILKRIRKGKVTVNLEHKGLERLINEIDRSSNRLSFALIVAALIVGSSLVMQLQVGPFVFGFPLLGFIGYLFAAILGIWLVVSILRTGKF